MELQEKKVIPAPGSISGVCHCQRPCALEGLAISRQDLFLPKLSKEVEGLMQLVLQVSLCRKMVLEMIAYHLLTLASVKHA